MNLTMIRRVGSSAVAGLAALIVLTLGFGCGSDRVRPAEECVLRANPVVFGDVAVGDTLVLDATVINTGRNPLDLIATLDSPDFRLAAGDSVPVSLAASDSVHLSVAYAPQTVGPKTAEIAFTGFDCPGVEVTGGTPKAVPGFVTSFPLTDFPGDSWIPIGITVGPDGNIYADFYDNDPYRGRFGDYYSTAVALAPDGAKLNVWGPIAQLPDGIAACPDGSFLVVDSGKGACIRCTNDGEVLEHVGLSRWSPGRFGAPRDVAVDEDGVVYVADSEAHRVQKLTRDGESIEFWTEVDTPWHLHADRRGSVFVSGSSSTGDRMVPTAPSIAKFSTAGELAFEWVSYSQSITGLTTDRDGFLYFAVAPFLMGPIDGITKITADGHQTTRLASGHSFRDVAADSAGFLYGVTTDSLYKITTAGDSVAAWPYGGVSVALDEASGLYVLNADRVTHLTLEGELLGQWGAYGTADGQFRSAGGITVAPDGAVLVADTNNGRIQELSPTGGFLGKFGNVMDEPGWLSAPVDAAVSADGTIYMATTGDNRIQRFASDGTFLTRWGGSGKDPGQFDSPRGIATGGSGDVYVWDTGNRRVQVFDADGVFVRAWEPDYALGTVEPWPATSNRGKSTGIAVSADDVVYMTDVAAHRVVVFSADGVPLGSWGGLGTGPGRFDQPRDIAVGADGKIYVVDYGNRRIQIFQLQSP